MRAEAMTAAKWWADKLRGPAKMDAGSSIDGHRDTNLEMAEVMATMLHATEERPASDADKLEAAIAAWVDERLAKATYAITLSTDYGPDYELAGIARSAGIGLGMASLPWKTVMWIRAGDVSVSEGYGAETKKVPLLEAVDRAA